MILPVTITIEFEAQVPFAEINKALKALESTGYFFTSDGYRAFKGTKAHSVEFPMPEPPKLEEPTEPVEIAKKPKKKKAGKKRKGKLSSEEIKARDRGYSRKYQAKKRAAAKAAPGEVSDEKLEKMQKLGNQIKKTGKRLNDIYTGKERP